MKNFRQRKERRNARVHSCLSSRKNKMLGQLGTSCKKRPSTMSEMLLSYCLENESIINEFQEKYNVNPAYKIIGFHLNQHGFWEYEIGEMKKSKAELAKELTHLIEYQDGPILTPVIKSR